jgi:hypothetical protein
MQTQAVVAVVFGALLACRGLGGKDENKGAKASAASAELAAGSAPRTSGKTYPQSPDKPLEWAAGQWTRHHLNMGPNKSTLTYKILKHDGDDFLLEVFAENAAQGDTVIQIVLTMKGIADAKNARIKSARLKMPGGGVQEFEGAMLDATQGMYKHFLGLLTLPDFASMPREEVSVAAGVFSGCYKNTKPTNIPGVPSTGPSWVHFSVPISAIVKVSGLDGTTQMELVDFGLTGAKSQM